MMPSLTLTLDQLLETIFQYLIHQNIGGAFVRFPHSCEAAVVSQTNTYAVIYEGTHVGYWIGFEETTFDFQKDADNNWFPAKINLLFGEEKIH